MHGAAQTAWVGGGMPRQTDFKTSAQQSAGDWDDLYHQAQSASLDPLPGFSELGKISRDELFRDLGYTFWNCELLDALLIRLRAEGNLQWVELAAGTGRLTAELARRGVRIAATDDYSQAPEAVRARERTICYGRWVGRLSAREALATFSPEAVVCAWPPLGSWLVPDLLAGQVAGSERLRLIVCIGDPNGATEAPVHAHELAAGWVLASWLECARWLMGFNDPVDAPGSHSRLLVYRRDFTWEGNKTDGA